MRPHSFAPRSALGRRFVGLCALAALTGTLAITHAPVASAQPKKAAAAEEDPKEGAKKAYGEASKLFKEGKYEEALPLFQKADELYPGAAPKHKIAICLDKMGKTEEAVAAYQTFIDSDPGEKYADRVTEAQKRIDELQARCRRPSRSSWAPRASPARRSRSMATRPRAPSCR